MTDRVPHALRPNRSLYIAVAKLVEDDSYLELTRSEFIGELMRLTSGTSNPLICDEIYRSLMVDAGLSIKE